MDRNKLVPVQITKSHTAKILGVAEADETPGTFRALVSVFGNEDYHGDIVEAGAFTRSLHEWALKSGPMAVVWSHKYGDIDSFIGEYTEMKETDKGLEVTGVLDLHEPVARRVYELMERGIINEFSWSGEVREYELIEDDESFWPSLKILDVDLWEAGPCFKGANPETELLSIKASGHVTGALTRVKAGRVLSADNYAKLKTARDQISAVLEAAQVMEDEPADEGKAVEGDPDTAKGLEPAKLGVEPEHNVEAGDHVQALLELITIDPMEGN